MNKEKSIIIIGAGLCGTLLAIRMGQRGFKVKLYEKRSDLRKAEIGGGRSINLALSARGLMALDKAGLKARVQEDCIPMYGRMIHTKEGTTFLSPYSGRKDDYINSVSRGGLNCLLLDEAEKMDNIEIHFEHKCTKVDLENAKATFSHGQSKNMIEVGGDFVIGTDGAGSIVRRTMMGQTTKLLFNYSQDFLRHGYKELSILPAENGGYKIEKNALHIWPRGSFMIIALPNMDGSFTLTMFHPYMGEAGFDTLNDEKVLQDFFKEYYPDLLPHIPHYIEEYKKNGVGTLGTIKCYPWQAYGKTLLMGDAAHAIVPFYGQGMNASFEDVRVFDELLDTELVNDWELLFERFQMNRIENTSAIADLAIDNFYEMQDKVSDPTFMKKRKLEMILEQKYPNYYSKYSLVTFKPKLSYKEAMIRGRKQDEILLKACAKVDDISEIDEAEILKALNF